MNQLRGTEYLLDGYCALGEPRYLVKKGVKYTYQRFQGEHKNEFLLRARNGDVFLFKNNVLKQKWKENESGQKSDEFVVYKNGRVDFRQRFQDIYDQRDFCCIVNHGNGLRMEIWSMKTGLLIYHGGFNEQRQKEGWGIEYSEKSGKAVLEGVWSKGILKEVIRLFDEDTMTELKRNGENSLDPVKRIPIYVGGYRYDSETEIFYREGVGCLIDGVNGVAYREGEWKDGMEVCGRDLLDGWYNPKAKLAFTTTTIPTPGPKPASVPDLKVDVNASVELNRLNLQVTELVISSNCCNDLDALDLNRFEWLRTLEIGDECFESVKTFKMDGLNRLKSLKIGKSSFTQVKQEEWDLSWDQAYRRANNSSKSFHLLNCESLKSVEIGEYSFSDFAGEFELNNLPALQILIIGVPGKLSSNFWWSSFVVHDLLNLKNLKLGNCSFCLASTTVLENLPSLQSIELGWCALEGRDNDVLCSLRLRNLPDLLSINSMEYSFYNPRSVKLENIPNLQNLKLPQAFKKVQTKSIFNVCSKLANLVKTNI